MSSFSSNLERLMNKRDMSDSELAELVDVNRTTVTRWRKGIRSPKLDKLPEIANV
ncbi:helix-turn-helix transcriptional regulator, partial [Staphylococcus aureus]